MVHPGIVIKDNYIEEEKRKVLQKFDIKGDYILYLGTIEPRKNIKSLIEAFSTYLFENEESKVTLVLAGTKGWKFQPIFKYLQNINSRLPKSQIKYVGKVSNRERNILLKNTQAFVFPSKYEGFGFPVLEAMAMKVPVLTSNNSSLREIAGEGAALLIDSEDPGDIRRSIKKILEDKILRRQLVLAGEKKVSLFTWENSVAKFQTLIK